MLVTIGGFWRRNDNLGDKNLFFFHNVFSITYNFIRIEFVKYRIKNDSKLGCVVKMVVDSILSHAEIGPNDNRKYAPRLELFHRRYHDALLSISFNILTDTLLLLLIATSKLESK